MDNMKLVVLGAIALICGNCVAELTTISVASDTIFATHQYDSEKFYYSRDNYLRLSSRSSREDASEITVTDLENGTIILRAPVEKLHRMVMSPDSRYLVGLAQLTYLDGPIAVYVFDLEGKKLILEDLLESPKENQSGIAKPSTKWLPMLYHTKGEPEVVMAGCATGGLSPLPRYQDVVSINQAPDGSLVSVTLDHSSGGLVTLYIEQKFQQQLNFEALIEKHFGDSDEKFCGSSALLKRKVGKFRYSRWCESKLGPEGRYERWFHYQTAQSKLPSLDFDPESNGNDVFTLEVQGQYVSGLATGVWAEADFADTDYYRFRTHYFDGQVNGAYEEWADGYLHYSAWYRDDKQDGPEIYWREDGTMEEECLYRNGVKQGACTRFSKDGSLKSVAYYRDGEKVSDEYF